MVKNPHKIHHSLVDDVSTIILAGGKGTRLFPLTKHRCKPAVIFGGRYRLIDIPISNSLNSGVCNLYILSQYFSHGLNSHITNTFKFDDIQGGSIELLYPEEVGSTNNLYQGTADAVRKNLSILKESTSDYFLILSGDQLYNMNLFEMVQYGKSTDADLVIATLPVEEKDASRMGLMKINDTNQIIDFAEKPKDPNVLKDFILKDNSDKKKCLASMGIYLFKKECLFELLDNPKFLDFGHDIIPKAIKELKVQSYLYDGYWEDIGTVSSYFHANLALTQNKLGLNLYDEKLPIFAKRENLPSARVIDSTIHNSIVSQGSIIENCQLDHCLLGSRVVLKKGSTFKNTLFLGNEYYTKPDTSEDNQEYAYIVEEGCHIENAIIDEHVHIGKNVKLLNEKKLTEYDGEGVYIRDGVIIVTSGTRLPDNFSL